MDFQKQLLNFQLLTQFKMLATLTEYPVIYRNSNHVIGAYCGTKYMEFFCCWVIEYGIAVSI